MSKQLSYQLFDLIKSLNKAEKRSFKLYAKRNFSGKDLKYVQLFDIIDKMKTYHESSITKHFRSDKASLLSNIKANLHEQILVSLKIINRKNPDIVAYELYSSAYALYRKGLYSQSLEVLLKAKTQANKINDNIFLLKIVDFEKQIEGRHITRKHRQRAKELIEQSENIKTRIYADEQWSNLSLQLYDYYLKFGHIKNERQLIKVDEYFSDAISKIQYENISFNGKIHKYKCFVWYKYITQDFVSCYNYSLKWINEFDKNDLNKIINPELYMRGLHNSLSSLFYCDDKVRFRSILQKLEGFVENNKQKFSLNAKVLAFIYIETAKINLHFLEGTYSVGVKNIDTFEDKLSIFSAYIDKYRIMVFEYKNACLYFGAGNYRKSVFLLNRVINNSDKALKEDIQSFARILNIIAHYELGNDEHLSYQIKNTYRFLLKIKDLDGVQKLVLKTIKQNAYTDRKNLTQAFIKFRKDYLQLMSDKYEWRSTLYLDILSWLDSKIENRTIEQIIWERKNS